LPTGPISSTGWPREPRDDAGAVMLGACLIRRPSPAAWIGSIG
jgi:hypothetical protein